MVKRKIYILKIFFWILLIITFLPKEIYAQMNALDDSCKMTPKLIPFNVNGKWGYCDKFYNIIIKPIFEYAEPFREIRYKKKIKTDSKFYATVKRNKLIYRIDTSGKVIEKIQLNYITESTFNIEPSATTKFKIYYDNNLLGVKAIRDDKIIVEAQYDSIIPFDPNLILYLPYKVMKNGKYGICRQDGIILLPLIYDEIIYESFYYLKIRLLLVKRDGKYFYVDYCGNEYKK